ncbi:MAG: hypothetical protein ACYDG4_14715 [Desulfuromonadaceae bacterium]
MIKFDFVVSEVDASNILSILQEKELEAEANSRSFLKEKMTRVVQANLEWWKGHAEYLNDLKNRVARGASEI